LLVFLLTLAVGSQALAQTQQMNTVESGVGTPTAIASDAKGNIYLPYFGYIYYIPVGTTGLTAVNVSGSGGAYPFSQSIVALDSDVSGDLFVAIQNPINNPNSGPYVQVFELVKGSGGYTWGGLVYGLSAPPNLNGGSFSTLNSMAYDNLNALLYVNYINGVDDGQVITCAPITIQFTGNTTAGSATVTSVSSTSGLVQGQLIGGGVDTPAGDTIASVGSGTITLKVAATNTATGALFGVFPTVSCNTITQFSGPLNDNYANGLAVDGAGNVYTSFTDSTNKGYIAQFPPGFSGAGKLYSPTGSPGGFGTFSTAGNVGAVSLAADDAGQVFVDAGPEVFIYSPSGFFSPVAGTGTNGFNGDNGTATLLQISNSEGVVLDPSGNLWIADTSNGRIREVSGAGIGQGAGTGAISSAPTFGCLQCGPQSLGNGTGGVAGYGAQPAPTDIIQTNHFSNLTLLNSSLHKLYVAYPSGITVFNTANDTVVTTGNAVDFIQQPNITQMVLDPATNVIWAINSAGQILGINSLNDQLVSAPFLVATGATAQAIAVDSKLNQLYVAYYTTSGITASYHVAVISGITETASNLLSLSGPAQALVADSTRGVAYLIAQDPYSACPSCPQYDYDLVVINGTTANGGLPIEIKSTTTLIEGSPYSSGVTYSSLAVDPNTGKVVFADAVDAYFSLFNPSLPSYEATDHVSLGWISNAVVIDTANSLAYITDSQYNNVQVVGLATVLSNTAFGFSANLFSGIQGGSSCGFYSNAVAPDPTTGEVYITTCTVASTINFTGTTVSGGTTVTVSSTSGLAAGQVVNGGGGAIPAGDTIATVGAGQITLTLPATSSVTGAAMSVVTSATQQLNMLQYAGYTVNGTTLTPNFTCGYGAGTCPPLDFATLPQANSSADLSYGYALNVDTSKHSVYLGNSGGNSATSALSNILVFNGPYPPAARPQQTLSATSLTYGSVGLGTNPAKNFSFTNNGAANLLDPVITFSGTNAADFAFTDGCAGGAAASGGFCVDQIQFAPSRLASESASALVIDNSPDVPETISLSGTGILPAGSGVTVSNTLLQVSKLQVAPGAQLTLYATISPAIGSSGEEVLFLDNTTNPASVVGVGSAQGGSLWTLNTSTLAAGTHPITAYYSGDATYAPSTSLTVNVVISATGTGPSQPLLSITPGSFYKPQNGATSNYSDVSIDSAGDVFVLDSGVGSVTEYTVGGATTTYLPASSYDQGSIMTHPLGIAVAPNGGTLYVADTQNSHIATSTSAGSSFLTPMQLYGVGACNGGTPTSFATLSGPTSISIGPPATPATEPNGSHVVPNSAGYDLYVTDTGNKRVLQINPVGGNTSACGYYPGGVVDAILAGTGSPSGPALVNPLSVAATGAIGNTTVYIADAPPAVTSAAQGPGTIYKNGIAIANTGQIVFPYSLATDAAGDLYYSDQSLSQVWRYDTSGNFLLEAGNGLNSTAAAGSCTSGSPCEATQNGILTPYGLAISGNGSIFIGDAAPTGQFGEVNVTTGTVNFPGQPTSTASNPVTITITDTASMAVGASGVVSTDPAEFTIAGGTCNTTAFTLQPGQSCTLLVTFSPQQAGSRTASINLTTQSEIYGGTVQTINFAGTGALPGSTPQTITFPPPLRPVTYGTAAVSLNATASSGLGVTYNVTGPGLLSGNSVSFTGAGTVKVVASQAGNGTYAAASSIEQDIAVLPASLVVTAQPASRTYDGPDPAFVDSITGIIPPDTLAGIVTGTPSFSVALDLGTTPANTALTVTPALGTLALNSANPDSADYIFTLSPGTLTVVCCEAQNLLPGSLPPANFPIPVGAPFALTAASTAGLPVSFTVLSGPGTISTNASGGEVLTATATGLITVQASAPGNANIAASPTINLTFLGQ
jgi:hypothetical protein